VPISAKNPFLFWGLCFIINEVKIPYEVKTMPNAKKRPKAVVVEPDVKPYNPTKSVFGRVVIAILAVGMFVGLVIAAVYGMIQVLR